MADMFVPLLIGGNILLIALLWQFVFQRKLKQRIQLLDDTCKAHQINELRYQHIIEGADIGIAVLQKQKFVYLNAAFSKRLGSYNPSYILHTDVSNHLHPDDVQPMLIRHMAVEQGARYTDIETRFFTQDNQVVYTETSALPIDFEGTASVLILVRDVSMRKQREDAFARQQRTMNTILDYAPIGIWMLGTDRKMKFMNKDFASKIGVTAEDFLNAEHYAELLPPDVGKRFMQSDGECIRSMSVHRSHEDLMCADGTQHVFEVVKAPILGDDKELLGVVTLAIDATERVTAEREKEEMQRQVEHTQRLESLGVLAGGIAHDFNNILTSILGNATLLKASMATLEDAAKLENVITASERASHLCRQMLAYSGKGHFVIERIQMSEMLHDMVQLLEVSIEKTVSIDYAFTQDLPKVEADVAQLQQVIMNLVINGSEAIEHSQGKIVVRTGQMTADQAYLDTCQANDAETGDFVYLEVEDNGSGMSAEVKSKIFDPFFTTKFTGRGLGMSAILGIVRGHHGALHLDSNEGKGTTFRVLFPTNGALSDDETDDEVTIIREIPKSLKGTVLVIDDESMVLDISTTLLIRMGFDVLKAEDGQKGVEVFEASHSYVCLVLLDLTMPRMSGKECFVKLREINPTVPVLFSSGYSEEDSMRGFAQELISFVQKPYSPEELQQHAYQLLRQAHEDD